MYLRGTGAGMRLVWWQAHGGGDRQQTPAAEASTLMPRRPGRPSPAHMVCIYIGEGGGLILRSKT